MHAFRSMASALLLSTTTLLTWTYAPNAHAATTYLVQLGSYETDKQAMDQWNKVNKRFPNLFGSLKYIPKTVKMPPDNITYHRTQAGPLKSRGDAESICDDMQVSGYECYVVETAIANPESQNAPTAEAAPSTTNTKPLIESAKAKVASLPNTEAKPTASAEAALPPRTEPYVKASDRVDAMKATALKKEAAPLPKAVKAAEDPEIEEMFTQATKDEARAKSSPEKQAASTKSAVPPVAPPTIQDNISSTPTDTVNLLNNLNKKADSGATTNASREEERTLNASAAPIVKEEEKTFTNKTIAPTKADVSSLENKPTADARENVASNSPFQMGESRYVKITSPDAPLPWLQNNTNTKDTYLTMPQPEAATYVRAEPASPRVENPTDANVEVSEAIRVPLSTLPQAEVHPTYNNTPDAGRFGYPSQALSKTNLWAEIGYFPNQNAALGYWQTLHERAKDLPEGLRVRVTKPFMKYSSTEQLSVRVGPFASINAIRSLCTLTQAEQLHCKSVKEFGDSTSTKAPTRQRYENTGRYYQRKHQLASGWKPLGLGANNSYYIQLGSYTSPVTAQDTWESLKSSHKDAFAGVSEQIISPKFSSASSGRYRLRAGPFGSNVSAVNACEELRRDGVLCLVVSGN